ncbi:hypothetical protein ABLE94_00610 [Gordonia sp. VNK1]|uniref:hypothetical protein n=1 Tax=Gordonia oleivorans TaxID=3156618 RepID=UPI0032B59CB4
MRRLRRGRGVAFGGCRRCIGDHALAGARAAPVCAAAIGDIPGVSDAAVAFDKAVAATSFVNGLGHDLDRGAGTALGFGAGLTVSGVESEADACRCCDQT